MNRPLLHVFCCGLLLPFLSPECLSSPPDAPQNSSADTETSTEALASEPEEVDTPAAVDSEPAAFLLQYRFTPGQTLRYETKQETTMEAIVQESRTTDRTEVIQRRQFTVQNVDDQGIAHLTMQFEYVRMQRQANDSPPVVFDSKMKDDQIPEMFKLTAEKLKGSAARYWLTADGRPAESSDRTEETASDGQDGRKPVPEATTFLMPLPSEAIRVGESWKDSQVVKVRVTAEINREVEILRTFRLQAVRDGIATIELYSSIASSVTNPVVRSQLIQSVPRGTLEFDIDRGIMIGKQLRFDETVLNAMGQKTVVSSFGRHIEKLLPSTADEEQKADARKQAAIPELSAR